MKLAALRLTFAFLLAVGRLWNCTALADQPQPRPASHPDVQQLSVFPTTLHLADGRSMQQLLATGQDIDGFLRDVTANVHYRSEDPAIARVDAGGSVRPVAAGKTTVRISGFGKMVGVPVTVGAIEQMPPVSFVNEVMAVLGKAGCNAGACHGNASGKGGFKLSLRGYNPGADLEALTRDQLGRRINLLAAESSLVLQKPAGLVEHGGGQRFGASSESYRLLLQWLQEGAQGDHNRAPRLEKIEVFPEERILPRPGLTQQLSVRAHFAGGLIRDVTRQAIYDLTTQGIVEVDGRGLVVAREAGEAPVLVRFLGKKALSRISVIQARPDFAWSNPAPHNFIDTHVFAKLKLVQTLPSELSSDTEFLRRVGFDTVGLPPTPAEVRAFLADRRPDKRNRKIAELLDRPEFADVWALHWLDLLRADETPGVMYPKGVWALSRWLRKAVEDNMPYDQFVRAFLTARGSQLANPPAALSHVFRQPNEKAEAVAQIFLGTRLECAQCHDHPFDRWTQGDYNSLATFFYQLARKDGQDYYAEGQVYLEPEKNKMVHLRFLDGSAVNWPPADRLASDKGDGVRDRRIALADWMLGPAKHWTARVLVNRVWGKLLGRGIVEPVDDFRFSNPPVNEPLLDALAEDFIAHGYDFKRLVGTILHSRTYQTSSRPNATNGPDQTYFSRAVLRRLTAEQLLDGLAQATGIEEEFRGLPAGLRAAQVPTIQTGSYFLKAFGRPPRKSVCACERSQTPTLPQILHLMNGTTMMKRLRAEGGTLDRLLKEKRGDNHLIEDLYLHTLSRPPQPAELARARAYLTEADDRAQAAEDLFWALLNSRQFLFNH